MRSTAETIALDASLRQSRSIYVTLAIVLFPLAVVGAFSGLPAAIDLLTGLPSGRSGPIAILVLLVSAILVGADVAMIRQCIEANARLRTLRDNPTQRVRRMHAPFQSSLFGPYH